MRRLVRANLPCALVAAAASVTMGWLGLYGFAWSDYEDEAKPAFDALIHGHLVEFLRLAPAYGGSLMERAPFAMLPGLWGGGALAVYRMVALPCLVAAGALGIWLCARMRAAHRPRFARAVALGVCVANPLTLRALELGHPEELLGACLCVAAVVLAADDRPVWSGALLGLAIANKEWALLALGPALLALPERRGLRRRLLCLACASAVAAAVLAPLALASSSFTASTRALASPANAIFQPWQIWWFFGHHGKLVHGLYGAPKPGYRTDAAWAVAISHPLIPAAGVLLIVALWLTRRRSVPPGGRLLSEGAALLALALLMAVRCVLDTWDVAYYPLPFIFALLAWEVGGRDRPELGDRPPVIALSCTVLAWLSFQGLPEHGVGADLQAAFFLSWTLPLCAWLALMLYVPGAVPAWRRRVHPPLDRGPVASAQQAA